MSNEIIVTNASVQELGVPSTSVTSVNGKAGVVNLTQDDIGDGETYVRYSKTEKERVDDAIAKVDESLDNKLDKTTETSAVYATDSYGNQTTIKVSSSALKSLIVRRDGNADVIVKDVPVSANGATSKKYVDDGLSNKLDKLNIGAIVYTTDNKGNPSYKFISSSVYSGAAVLRDTNGDIILNDTPVSEKGATSKKYVENKINEKTKRLEKRVTELENLTLTHIEDEQPSTVIWPKSAPRDCGSTAFIKRIEGKTERVPVYSSKNLLNPKSLEFGGDFDSYVYNDDGSITYTVSEYAEIQLTSDLIGGEAGIYYVYVEGGQLNLWADGGNICCEADLSEELMDYVPATRNLKVMIYKDDSETVPYVEFREAPEGTVFEPYAEPTYTLKHQNVSSINCYTANLFGGSALKEAIVSKYPTKAVVDEASKTITLPSGNYIVSFPNIVSALDGSSLCLVIKGQGYFKAELHSLFDDASILINSASQVQMSAWGSAPAYEVFFSVTSTMVICYEECGIFMSSYHHDFGSVESVSDFQPYQEEPIGTFIVPNQYWSNRGVEEYKNTLEWIDDEFVATQRIVRIVLDGTEDWSATALGTDYAYFFIKIGELGDVVPLKIVSDIYPTVRVSSSNTNVGIHSSNSASGEDRLLIRPENVKEISLNKFKQMLSENPVTAEYVITKPKVTRYPIEEVPNELPVKSLGIIRFLDDEGNVVDGVGNSIAYVVRKGDTNNAYEE